MHDRKNWTFQVPYTYTADHITSTSHNIKWDNFGILGTGRSDIHCIIKETLLIRDLKPTLNAEWITDLN